MPVKEINIPLYINGRERRGADISLEYDKSHGPVKILLPSIGPDQIAEIGRGARDLAGITIEDILEFLRKVQAIWADENNALRKEAFELARLVTGFHEKELEIDFGYIPALLSEQLFLGPTLESELRDPSILDEWRVIGGSRVRAFPRGRVLHILAGNVPGSELLSLMRGVLTKNANILKMASGNPVTPVYIMKSFLQVNPEHPVTRSTSVVYWPHQSPTEGAAFALADAVCVWGGFDAVHSAWKNSRPSVPVLDYGPKRSMLFIDRESVRADDACAAVAAAIADDIVIHDQLACHSPQVAFVERPADRFCEALGAALAAGGRKFPKGHVSIDQNAHISHTRMMSELRGDKVYHPQTNEWSIIVTGDFARTMETPLSRTLYVLEVDELDEAVRFADKFTMVIGFSSSKKLEALKDKLSLRGVDRFTRVGHMGLIPPGFPHEGRYDLTRLVRWVGADNLPPW
jgi:long-chain-fatty-acyl-CoA reductase